MLLLDDRGMDRYWRQNCQRVNATLPRFNPRSCGETNSHPIGSLPAFTESLLPVKGIYHTDRSQIRSTYNTQTSRHG